MTVTEHRIAATAATVSAVLADPTTYPQWLVGAKRIRSVDHDWPSPGSSFEHEVGVGPVEVRDRTEACFWQAGRELDLRVRARPLLVADVRFDIEPAGAGTLVRMTESPRGVYRVFAPLIAPLVRWRNARSLHRLAELVEGST